MAPKSRREVLQLAAFAAVTTVVTSSTAQAKATQTLVAYQGEPKGTQRCDGCALWEAPNACKVVDGQIAPQGWCKAWAPAKR
jgi:high potential iron-sulfur protein